MMNNIVKICFFCFCFSVFCNTPLSAQTRQTVIQGVVRDSVTKEGMPFATIVIKDTKIYAQTDENGRFVLTTSNVLHTDSVRIIYTGYIDKYVHFVRGKVNRVNVEMISGVYDIGEIVVNAKVGRYKKRDNPALELLRNVISHNAEYSLDKRHSHYDYERYEKITISVHDFAADYSGSKLEFLEHHRDTNEITGKPSLPVIIKELLIDTHIDDSKKSETIIAKRSGGIDERLTQSNVDTYLGLLLEEIDIFKPNVYFLMRDFVSPLSPLAPNFYKYYIDQDTVAFNGDRSVVLRFEPFDKYSLGFRGKLYVSTDGSFFVNGAELNFPNSMNLNFVYNTIMRQNFERGSNGERLLTRDDVYCEFMIFSEKDANGFDIRRINSYRDYSLGQKSHENSELGQESRKSAIASDADASYWAEHRHFPISRQEEMIEGLLPKLRKMTLYRVTEGFIAILADEYYRPGGAKGKFDMGPILYFLSNNNLEGLRLSFGGVTTPNLHRRLFLEAYAAYGFKDNKFKWNGALEYSFVDKKNSVREFPVHSIRVEANYDTYRFGREIGEYSRENVASWLQRQVDSTLIYSRNYQVIYSREMLNNLSIYATARSYTQYDSPLIHFSDNGSLSNISMSELKLKMRYAPEERILENSARRRTLERHTPIFELSHTIGFDGVLGGDYSRNLTEFKFIKRFGISPVGHIDVNLKLGAEWNTVPYILLPYPRVDMSYILRPDSYLLMNPLEFMYDKYAKWDVSWHLGGYLLNKIPLIKRLKFREVIWSRGMCANLSDKNNPTLNSNLLPFPKASSPIGPQPYVEVGVGVENIFKLFRVDYVRRVTYKANGPNNWAILVSASAKF